MEFEEKGILLTAESKPYDFGGNSGVSHNIRVSLNGEIFSCKSDENQVQAMKKYEGQSGNVVVKIASRKEKLSASLVSFEPNK